MALTKFNYFDTALLFFHSLSKPLSFISFSTGNPYRTAKIKTNRNRLNRPLRSSTLCWPREGRYAFDECYQIFQYTTCYIRLTFVIRHVALFAARSLPCLCRAMTEKCGFKQFRLPHRSNWCVLRSSSERQRVKRPDIMRLFC